MVKHSQAKPSRATVARASVSANPGQRGLNTVRIISGSHRTRKIRFPDAPGLRPTSDRIRETLFNWLRDKIHGARCLDLFAGSGALSFESLSRGASWVQLVESNAQVAAALRASLAQLQFTQADVQATDALHWLARNANSDEGLDKGLDKGFDIVFLDPPFAANVLPQVCALLGQARLLNTGARIYIEEDVKSPAFALPPAWSELKTKRAGNVRFSLYGVSDPAES